MRVCVLFGGAPVCGPTRVTDAVSAVKRTQADGLFEIAQFSFGAPDLEFVTFVDDRDARGVIAAIFELSQPINDERHYLFVAYVTNDSTHTCDLTPLLTADDTDFKSGFKSDFLSVSSAVQFFL